MYSPFVPSKTPLSLRAGLPVWPALWSYQKTLYSVTLYPMSQLDTRWIKICFLILTLSLCEWVLMEMGKEIVFKCSTSNYFLYNLKFLTVLETLCFFQMWKWVDLYLASQQIAKLSAFNISYFFSFFKILCDLIHLGEKFLQFSKFKTMDICKCFYFWLEVYRIRDRTVMKWEVV